MPQLSPGSGLMTFLIIASILFFLIIFLSTKQPLPMMNKSLKSTKKMFIKTLK